MPQRNFTTDFSGGAISCVLSLEGYKADELPDMLDNVHRVVSKQVHKSLIPHLNELMLDQQAVLPGSAKVTESVKVELLDHMVTLDITLDLNSEPVAPHKETLGFLIVNAVATDVIRDMLGRLSSRVYNETTREYFKQHPESAPSVSLRDILSMAGGPGPIVGVAAGPFGTSSGEQLL